MENTSPKYKLNFVDLYKIVRGAGVTLVGALLTYIAGVYMNVDYTVVLNGHAVDLTGIAVVGIGALIEAGRRWFTDHSQGSV